MISYKRDSQQTIPVSTVKIIGLGGAGANMLERVTLDGAEGSEVLAVNTDSRTLAACMAGEKIQLGRNLTKGLGAGGDPELGQQAMLEAEEEVRASLRGRKIVFLCVGLGGGTGSGAAPVITRIAREEGAFVVVFATMPFGFEGRRRREQAETSLNELAVLSNALVTFDNNRMGELVLAKQGIHEAFAAADRMICESIKAVIRLVIRPGLVHVGLDDLMSALRTNRSRCLFGSGMAKGKDRAAAALRNALSSPLLDQGALLKEARTVLVHLCGGDDLTLSEVELLMQRLRKFVPEKAHVLFGAAVDASMGENLSVTVISALPEDILAQPSESSHEERAFMEPTESFAGESEIPEPFTVEPEPAAPGEPARAKEPEPEPLPTLFDEIAPFAEAEPAEDFAAAPPAPVAAPEPEPLPEPEPQPEPAEVKPAPFAFTPVKRNITAALKSWGRPQKSEDKAVDPFAKELDPPPAPAAPEPVEDNPFSAVPETPKLKLGVKSHVSSQNELALDSTPRGRFEGQGPNVVDGEDLDLPPFLRKKKLD